MPRSIAPPRIDEWARWIPWCFVGVATKSIEAAHGMETQSLSRLSNEEAALNIGSSLRIMSPGIITCSGIIIGSVILIILVVAC